MAHLFIISSAKSVIHLPRKSCDTKESRESFALRENMKALTWEHRFLSNDTGNPYLYTYNHSRPIENEILNCGVWDQWFSHILWALHISLFAIFAFPSSVLENWFLQVFCCCYCFVFGTTHCRKKKLSHDSEKKNLKHQPTQKKNIVCQMLREFSHGLFESCLLLFFKPKYLLNRWFLWKNWNIWEECSLESSYRKYNWTH